MKKHIFKKEPRPAHLPKKTAQEIERDFLSVIRSGEEQLEFDFMKDGIIFLTEDGSVFENPSDSDDS